MHTSSLRILTFSLFRVFQFSSYRVCLGQIFERFGKKLSKTLCEQAAPMTSELKQAQASNCPKPGLCPDHRSVFRNNVVDRPQKRKTASPERTKKSYSKTTKPRIKNGPFFLITREYRSMVKQAYSYLTSRVTA